tara:strand:+ start:498 stop:869 length:372 start_codon:yes stop_codon:yes gene_type:complete
MCFTQRKREKKKKRAIYPYFIGRSQQEIENVTTDEFLRECIACYHCKRIFNIGSSELKIHCAGCNQFFHCGIAGKCRGKNCASITTRGKQHELSWCINCVPKIEGNEEKINGEGTCICKDCLE